MGSICRMAGTYERLVNIVRILFGLDMVINGVNWWFKLVTPYPSISDFVDRPPPPDFVGAMSATGVIFHVVKGTELIAGLLLLANRFVPLALIAAFPISVNVFLVDWFLAQRLRAEVMGTGALLMNAALILAYLDYYRPLLKSRSIAESGGSTNSRLNIECVENMFTRFITQCRPVILLIAALNGLTMIIWVLVMIAERQMH